jgi:hypothetical protein
VGIATVLAPELALEPVLDTALDTALDMALDMERKRATVTVRVTEAGLSSGATLPRNNLSKKHRGLIRILLILIRPIRTNIRILLGETMTDGQIKVLCRLIQDRPGQDRGMRDMVMLAIQERETAMEPRLTPAQTRGTALMLRQRLRPRLQLQHHQRALRRLRLRGIKPLVSRAQALRDLKGFALQ